MKLKVNLILLFKFNLIACLLFTTSFSLAQVPDLTEPTNEWQANGGDLFNRRFSPLEQINTENVKDLKANWRIHLGGSGGGFQHSGESQTIVENGVAYLSTGDSDIFAINIDDGEILWQYRANLQADDVTVCCGWLSRGVAIGDGKVFHGNLDNKIVALDQDTGEIIWEIQSEPTGVGYSITSAPLYYNDQIFIGYAGGETGIRGRIRSFDATDGSLLWTFYTIPEPGKFGHDTWPEDSDVYERGGAAIWHTPALDPELGMLYFSTSNPAPGFGGAFGAERPGDNLFSSSILALDYKTGEYRWHFQEVHHDIWDYDASNPIILFNAEYNNVERKGLVQAGKTGWLYILDRLTGEPLIGIEERPVLQEPRMATAATQPYPLGDSFVPQSLDIPPEGYKLVNNARIFTPFYDEPVVMTPGLGGGASWAPSAMDPRTKIMYVCAADNPLAFQGPSEGGFSFPSFPFPNKGVLSAMDLHTNKVLWQQHWNETCLSGIAATAGGLIFVGHNDGRLTALNSSDGGKLWEFETEAGMHAPVTVFEYEGTQYVIAYSAGNQLGGSTHGDSVWLFSLQGTIESEAAEGPGEFPFAAPIDSANLADSIVNIIPASGKADLAKGQMIFRSICAACHGEDGTGGHGGGANLSLVKDSGTVINAILNGGEKMPSLAAAVTPEQLRDVSAHVVEVLSQ